LFSFSQLICISPSAKSKQNTTGTGEVDKNKQQRNRFYFLLLILLLSLSTLTRNLNPRSVVYLSRALHCIALSLSKRRRRHHALVRFPLTFYRLLLQIAYRMGNANGREDGSIPATSDPSVVEPVVGVAHAPDSRPPVRAFSSDSMANSPPQSPRRSRSPILFGPQVLPAASSLTSASIFLHFGVATLMRWC